MQKKTASPPPSSRPSVRRGRTQGLGGEWTTCSRVHSHSEWSVYFIRATSVSERGVSVRSTAGQSNKGLDRLAPFYLKTHTTNGGHLG